MNIVQQSSERWRAQFAAVRDEATGDDQRADAFARAVLGTLAEPGDGVLGRLLAALGAERTAVLLLERASADVLA